MTDFLDDLGTRLAVAEKTLWRKSRSRRRRRLLAAGSVVGLVAAVPALAATQPWSVVFGRPKLHDTPASVAASSPPRAQTALLGVFRRPQIAGDRGPLARKLLRSVGVEYRGVRSSAVRIVITPSGRAVALVSARSIGNPTSAAADIADAICMTTGDGGVCGGTEQLLSGNLMSFAGPDVAGVVPDGVARVVLRYPDGSRASGDVRANVFSIVRAPVVTQAVAGAPSRTVSAKPSRIEWLDVRGRVVGPTR